MYAKNFSTGWTHILGVILSDFYNFLELLLTEQIKLKGRLVYIVHNILYVHVSYTLYYKCTF